MSKLPLYRTTARITRKHSRLSLIAASAVAAGALGAVGFAAGAAPYAQAFDNVGNTLQTDTSATSGHPANSPSGAATGANTTGKPSAATQLDTLRSAATGGSTSPNAAAKHAPAKQAASANKTTSAPAKATLTVKEAAQVKQAAAAKAAAQAKKVAHAKAAAAAAAARQRAAAAPAKPYLMYDSVLPGTLPAGNAAVYANGQYAVSASQVAGHKSVLWIDTNGSDPGANVLDVEPGDATPAGAAQWAQQRLSSQPHSVAIIYTMMSDWQQVKDNVAALPGWMQSKVRYWIADPTGVPHIVAGASATQWYWGSSYDITTANPGLSR